MELKEYLNYLKKNLAIIAAFALFGLFIAAITTTKLPKGYQKTGHLFLTPPKISQSPTFNSEGFYAQEMARNFTDTAVAILKSPEFTTNLPISPDFLEVRKIAPQVIAVTVSTQTPQTTSELFKNLIESFNQQMLSISSQDQVIQMKTFGKDQEVFYSQTDKKTLLLAGSLAGAVIAIFVVSLKVYFKV